MHAQHLTVSPFLLTTMLLAELTGCRPPSSDETVVSQPAGEQRPAVTRVATGLDQGKKAVTSAQSPARDVDTPDGTSQATSLTGALTTSSLVMTQAEIGFGQQVQVAVPEQGPPSGPVDVLEDPSDETASVADDFMSSDPPSAP